MDKTTAELVGLGIKNLLQATRDGRFLRRGNDPEILRRLVEAGCRKQCDALVRRGRNHMG